jgi:hypothetical protein
MSLKPKRKISDILRWSSKYTVLSDVVNVNESLTVFKHARTNEECPPDQMLKVILPPDQMKTWLCDQTEGNFTVHYAGKSFRWYASTGFMTEVMYRENHVFTRRSTRNYISQRDFKKFLDFEYQATANQIVDCIGIYLITDVVYIIEDFCDTQSLRCRQCMTRSMKQCNQCKEYMHRSCESNVIDDVLCRECEKQKYCDLCRNVFPQANKTFCKDCKCGKLIGAHCCGTTQGIYCPFCYNDVGCKIFDGHIICTDCEESVDYCLNCGPV